MPSLLPENFFGDQEKVVKCPKFLAAISPFILTLDTMKEVSPNGI